MVDKTGISSSLNFITPTLVKVLELFFADPMQEYHEREVVRRAEVSKGAANEILHALSHRGFLTSQKKGRMVFYRLDLKNPSTRQFKVLSNVYSLGQILQRLQSTSRRIVLFGSCSQGTDVKESDIDLMILTEEKEVVRRVINRFNSNEKRRITPIIVNANEMVRLKRGDRALYENIERGIVLWETE